MSYFFVQIQISYNTNNIYNKSYGIQILFYTCVGSGTWWDETLDKKTRGTKIESTFWGGNIPIEMPYMYIYDYLYIYIYKQLYTYTWIHTYIYSLILIWMILDGHMFAQIVAQPSNLGTCLFLGITLLGPG